MNEMITSTHALTPLSADRRCEVFDGKPRIAERRSSRSSAMTRLFAGYSRFPLWVDRHHALDRDQRALGDLRVDRDELIRAHVTKAVAQLRQRDHLHVLADGLLVGGDELLVRVRLLERVDHPGLGRDDELV